MSEPAFKWKFKAKYVGKGETRKVKLTASNRVSLGPIGDIIADKALEVWKRGASFAEGQAKQRAPVETGATRDSIKAKAYLSGKGKRIIGWIKTGSKHGLWPEVGTKFMPPQPFLRPARDAAVQRIKHDLEYLV